MDVLTGANAIDNIVCILAETDLGKTGSFPISWLPANVQNLTWLTPTLTNWTSESGRNWARNIRLDPLPVAAILIPNITNTNVCTITGKTWHISPIKLVLMSQVQGWRYQMSWYTTLYAHWSLQTWRKIIELSKNFKIWQFDKWFV